MYKLSKQFLFSYFSMKTFTLKYCHFFLFYWPKESRALGNKIGISPIIFYTFFLPYLLNYMVRDCFPARFITGFNPVK